jgi:hypothetical protein
VTLASSTRGEEIASSLFVGFAAVAVGYLSLTRSYLTFGPETDFLDRYASEAALLLAGQPLEMKFHPPLYSIVLAGVFSLVEDWVRSGLIVTWVGSLAAMVGTFSLFRRIAGRSAAWGALLALITSRTFLSYAASATSDVFFLALYTLTCLVLSMAEDGNRPWPWLAAGILLGLSVLTRTNGITLSLFLAIPFLSSRPLRDRAVNGCCLAAGLMIPICGWGWLAYSTGSPLAPEQTHVTMAMTYFAQGSNRVSREGATALQEKFSSIVQVLSYDPARIATIYRLDLARSLTEIFAGKALLAFPLNWLSLPGLYFLCRSIRRPFGIVLVLAAVFQLLLVNFKFYEPRYLLFVVPLLGAGVGVLASRIFAWENASAGAKAFVAASMAAYVGVIGHRDFPRIHARLHAQDRELGEVLAAFPFPVEPNAVLYARKPHVPYYLGAKNLLFPEVSTTAQLEEVLRTQSADGTPVYLYYGSAERRKRPRLRDLGFAQQRPEWLEPLAVSEIPGTWALYRYREASVALEDHAEAESRSR